MFNESLYPFLSVCANSFGMKVGETAVHKPSITGYRGARISGGKMAGKINSDQYFQSMEYWFDFGMEKRISGIELQGGTRGNCWLQHFVVNYATELNKFKAYTEGLNRKVCFCLICLCC